jgi:prepilin-type N-terminal cleavage/methylation domain-containing protein
VKKLRTNKSKGMTLIELNIAILISSLFVVLTMTSLVVGTRIIRTSSTTSAMPVKSRFTPTTRRSPAASTRPTGRASW